MHVKQHRIIGCKLYHIAEEAVAIDVGYPAIYSGQKVDQLVEWCGHRAILRVEANDVLNVCALFLIRLTTKKLPGLLV